MGEIKYRRELIRKLEIMFPGCQIIKLDPAENQGIPDILILYRDQWAMLEIKASPKAHEQPNQAYYVGVFDEMSFASFINPSSEERVLDELQQSFGVIRKARIPQSQ